MLKQLCALIIYSNFLWKIFIFQVIVYQFIYESAPRSLSDSLFVNKILAVAFTPFLFVKRFVEDIQRTIHLIPGYHQCR